LRFRSQTVKVVKDIATKNQELIQKSKEVWNKFIKCGLKNLDIARCEKQIAPDLKYLKEEFLRVNEDSKKRMAERIRDMAEKCSAQSFLSALAPALLA